MTHSKYPRRVVTGHDASGKSIVLSDGPPAQHHQMKGRAIGADWFRCSRQRRRSVMHRTKTMDYVVMIEGEVVLLLDDSELTLRRGDVVVQRGTDHAWENRSDKVARMAFFHLDAEFSEELLAKLPKPLELMR